MDRGFRNVKLVKVIDGDTIRIDIDLGFGVVLKAQTCRLLGVQCPEVRGKQREQGLRSKNFVNELLRGRALFIQCKKSAKGSFSRWLITLFVQTDSNGLINVNEEIVQKKHGVKFLV